MSEITRTVQQLVADIHLDDDGLVRIHVTQPLTPDEARDAAAAIIVAAKAGDDYTAEQEALANDPAGIRVDAFCSVCRQPVVPDKHSTWGWRHLNPVPGPIQHSAQVTGRDA